MKKVPTIFVRDPIERKLVIDEINPLCDWVFDGDGAATQKLDGTCCLIKDGELYKRCTIKAATRGYPDNYLPADHDFATGKSFGWIPVDPDSKSDQWHMEAFNEGLWGGTHELIGPKVQGNPENVDRHILIPHIATGRLPDLTNRSFEGIREYLKYKDIEGVVFHHPDGRMGKIKKRDFGFIRK